MRALVKRLRRKFYNWFMLTFYKLDLREVYLGWGKGIFVDVILHNKIIEIVHHNKASKGKEIDPPEKFIIIPCQGNHGVWIQEFKWDGKIWRSGCNFMLDIDKMKALIESGSEKEK